MYILILVFGLNVTIQEMNSLESCKFAGKSFLSMAYGSNYKRDYKCVKK